MAWESRTVSYWTVCWKWIFPYPCKKTKTVYCCTGRWRLRCYLFIGEQWICCDKNEYHFWSSCFGIGQIDAASHTVCRDEVPTESREGCPTLGGGQAPPSSNTQSSGLKQAARNVMLGGIIGVIFSVAGTLLSEAASKASLAIIIGGAIVGGFFGAGTGKKCSRGMTPLILLITGVLIWLIFYK